MYWQIESGSSAKNKNSSGNPARDSFYNQSAVENNNIVVDGERNLLNMRSNRKDQLNPAANTKG